MTLIAVFVLQFVAIGAYKRRCGIDSVLQWLAVILVLYTNTVTYFIAITLQDHPINRGFGEVQIALTLCYVPFGAMRSLSPEHPFSRSGIMIGLVILFAALLLLVPFFVMNDHAVSLGALSRLSATSTQNDVEQLLGWPSNTYATENGIVWVYSGSTWCIVTVVFKQMEWLTQ